MSHNVSFTFLTDSQKINNINREFSSNTELLSPLTQKIKELIKQHQSFVRDVDIIDHDISNIESTIKSVNKVLMISTALTAIGTVGFVLYKYMG